MSKNCAVILAAGEGTRMKSAKPKVLAQVLFVPMIDWVVDAVREAGIDDICVVTGHLSEQVCDHLGDSCETVLQAQRLGTGHAVAQAKAFIARHSGGNVLVLNGDAPLIDSKTIGDSLAFHMSNGNSATVISAAVDNPTGYGRMVRSADGSLRRIVEQRDATDDEKKITEVNSGVYWFNCDDLLSVLDGIADAGRDKKEIYLTDAVEILLACDKRVDAFTAENADVILGANDRYQLMQLNEIARRKVLKENMLRGVDIPCTDGVIITPRAVIGADTQILPGTVITGRTVIGSGCVIGPDSKLDSCTVDDGCIIDASRCKNSTLGKNVTVGPFAHLRPGCVLSDGVHTGNFVEIKNSIVGKNTKVSHLTYIGDSDVGEGVNFGCGCATANYDGAQKFRTTVGDKAFVGCHTCLVAPVTVGEHAYTAAGSVVTDDVPDGTMAIARTRQTIKRKVRKYNED